MSVDLTNEFAESKTIVLWDLEDYKIPNGLSPLVISENIKTGLASMGYRGPVTLKAYCDEMNQIHEEEDGFIAAGITLTHVPERTYPSRDEKIMYGMFSWAMDNREEPTNLMVISDNVFVWLADTLKKANHNVLWTRLSAEGMPIAQSGRSLERLACSVCGIKIEHEHHP